jgi:hypothetical protein
LSASDKLLNRFLAGVRVEVEHVVSGVKRCRIVKDVLRLEGISELVMEIACALHNLRVSCRRPLSTSDLLNLVGDA